MCSVKSWASEPKQNVKKSDFNQEGLLFLLFRLFSPALSLINDKIMRKCFFFAIESYSFFLLHGTEQIS
jgi:hypothetical protein